MSLRSRSPGPNLRWLSVIQITGRQAKGKYSRYAGMKSAFKIAAVILLLVFTVGTASAALPCQFGDRISMHCGVNCPMMAMMQHRTAGESAPNIGGSSCCQRSSQPSTPATAQSVNERLTTYAIEPEERIDAVMPSAPSLQVHIDRNATQRNLHSRALLCTFLI